MELQGIEPWSKHIRRKLSTCLFAVFDLNQKVGTTKDTFSDPALNLIFLYEPQRKTSPIFWMIH